MKGAAASLAARRRASSWAPRQPGSAVKWCWEGSPLRPLRSRAAFTGSIPRGPRRLPSPEGCKQGRALGASGGAHRTRGSSSMHPRAATGSHPRVCLGCRL